MDAFTQVVQVVRRSRGWPAGESITVTETGGVVRVERLVGGRVVDAYQGAPGAAAGARKSMPPPAVDDRQLDLPATGAVSRGAPSAYGDPPKSLWPDDPEETQETSAEEKARDLLEQWKVERKPRARADLEFEIDEALLELADATTTEHSDAVRAEYSYHQVEVELDPPPPPPKPVPMPQPTRVERYHYTVDEEHWDALTQAQRDEVARIVEQAAKETGRSLDVTGVVGGVHIGDCEREGMPVLAAFLDVAGCPYVFTERHVARAPKKAKRGKKVAA